jgi:DNA-directed RNA polymerase sigma subunit (sigma70/sigma32)
MDNFVTRLSQISEKGTKFKYTMKSLEKIMEEGDQSYDKIANILKITKDKVKQYENEAKNKIIKYYNNNHKTI